MKFLFCFLLFIFTLNFSGCNMKHYCSRRFPTDTHSRKDSISFIEKTIYRDTIIFVHVPYESKTDTVLTDSLNSAYSTLTTSLAWSSAYFSNGRLIHFLQQNDSILAIKLKDAIKENSTSVVKIKEIIKVEEINKLSSWQNFQIYSAWILAAVILISSLMKKIPSVLVNKLLTKFTRKRSP